MKMTPVESSTIAAYGYDAPSQTLHVQFKPKKGQTEGDIYQYTGVGADIMMDFTGAVSIGKYFAAYIKDQFPTVKLGAPPVDILAESLKTIAIAIVEAVNDDCSIDHVVSKLKEARAINVSLSSSNNGL